MRLSRTLLLGLFLAGLPLTGAAQSVVGDMYASDASVRGSVLFSSAGTQIESGSSVSAGDAAALVRLKRGGEVRICPQTTVSVTASRNGRDLLWGMNTGSIESHFTLDATADTIMTPDFRILLAGPGVFHFAISADAKGNACVKALPSNTASLIVSELSGDGTYQVKPNAQVYFHNGTVTDPSPFVPADCGCPAPVPVLRAQNKPEPKPVAPVTLMSVPEPPISYSPPPPLPSVPDALLTPLALPPHYDLHLEMETPLVYSPASPELEMVMAVSRLRLTSGSAFGAPQVLPPVPAQAEPREAAQPVSASVRKAKPRRGFFGKIGSFFSGIFK